MAREMKDSGVAWIGKIPAEWKIKKMKHILLSNDGGIWGDDPLNDGTDKIVLRSTEQSIDGKWNITNPATRNLSATDYSKCRIFPGDLLITKSSGSDSHIGKTTLADDSFADTEYYFSNFIQRVRISGSVPAFAWYLMNSPITRDQFIYLQNSTSGIGNINASMIQNIYLPIPPITEQRCIIKFLDIKCAEIDAVLDKTHTSIEEYKKLKQAIITQAVTKGIRGDRPMKESGIEWIGAMPSNWELIPFRRLLKERQEKNVPIKSTERLSLSIDLGVTLYSEKTTNLDRFKDDFEQYKLAHEGDLVMNSMNMIVGATGISNYFGCVSPAYYTFYDELPDHAIAQFCEYVFRSKTMLRVLFSLGKGIYAIVRGDDRVNTCRLKVSKDDLKSIVMPVPPLDELREINVYLKEKSDAIDQLIRKKEKLLSKLESYKKSLIYEYVTGKKEV